MQTSNGVWNVYGKLQSLTNKDGQTVTYTYSADGQRISKKVGSTEEWYVRDESGNLVTTYTKDASINSGNLTVTEQYKYGSSLLDVKDAKINVESPVANDGFTVFERGDDNYILADGNGNTKATISDKKIQHSTDGTTVYYYNADVRTATLHSSFGANAKTYNGGFTAANFNSQRKSLEIGADAQTAQFWEYNSDVAIRWNVDPLIKNFPNFSPYAILRGNPIKYNDHTGAAPSSPIYDKKGKFLGTDDQGFKGQILFMSRSSYNAFTLGNSIPLSHQMAGILAGTIDQVLLNPTQGKVNMVTSAINDVVSKANIPGFSLSQLHNGKVSSYYYNIISSSEGTADAFVSNDGGALPMRYPAGTSPGVDNKGRYTITFNLSPSSIIARKTDGVTQGTVENIQNTAVHEAEGHIVKKIPGEGVEHAKAYELQMNDPTFQNTTPQFKAEVIEGYKEVKSDKL